MTMLAVVLSVTIYDVGPYIFAVIIAVAIVLAVLAEQLITAGLKRRGWLRWLCLGTGIPLAICVAIYFLAVCGFASL